MNSRRQQQLQQSVTKVETDPEKTFEDAMFFIVDETCSPEETARESTAERESKLQKLVNSADYSWRIKRLNNRDRGL